MSDASTSSNEQLQRERDAWESTAAQFARNMEYYQGLVDRIGRAIGPMAYTADDGSVSDGVLRAKVPEIIERSLKALRRIGNPRFVYSSDEDSDEDTQLSMRMADARAVLSGDPSPVETTEPLSRALQWTFELIQSARAEDLDKLRAIHTSLSVAIARSPEEPSPVQPPCTLTKGCWLESGHDGHCD